MLQEVAHHLQIKAHSLSGPSKDHFARSAYNRYYYACFLFLRDAFREMNPSWSSAPHKSYPEILAGQIEKRLKSERTKARRRGDSELLIKIEGALRSIPQIRSIITQAYATRIVADYEPSIKVNFAQENRFSLNSVEIDMAHDWHGRITILVPSVLDAWRQFNV